MQKFTLPGWLEHFLIGLIGQVVAFTMTYLLSQNWGSNTVIFGLLFSTAGKALLDQLQKVDPQAPLPPTS